MLLTLDTVKLLGDFWQRALFGRVVQSVFKPSPVQTCFSVSEVTLSALVAGRCFGF